MRPRASGRCHDADVAAAARSGFRHHLFDIMVKDRRNIALTPPRAYLGRKVSLDRR
jgi:hypothetical protein